MLQIHGTALSWLGHAGFKIRSLDKVIYIDPFNIASAEPADIILLTHPHYDHCSIADIMKIVKESTEVICTADSQSAIMKLGKKVSMQLIAAGDTVNVKNIEITAVPAYNKNKPFHQKSEEWVGYIIKLDTTVIYHAGDTDHIEEMQKLSGYAKQGNMFIALLPVGGKFTMTAQEAAQAAKTIHPTIAIPMHYGSVVGNEKDAHTFQQLCEADDIEAKILPKE